jgi:hypothetical protein
MIIGEVISSTDSVCVVIFNGMVKPRVGDWVTIEGNFGVIESYNYNFRSDLKAQIPFFNPENLSSAPIPPGAVVKPLSEGFLKSGIGIPAGYYTSFGKRFPLFLEHEHVLGPNGSHVNCNGISGLATKTSYLTTLLWGVEKTVPNSARFIINVKDQDLMNLHKSSEAEVDHEYYEMIGLESGPFKNVKYFSSFGSPSSKRKDVKTFGYSIQNGFASLENLMCFLDDKHRTITSLVEALIKGKEHSPAEFGPYKSWDAIWTQAPLCEDGIYPNSWSYFPLATTRRFLRELEMILKNKNTGLFLNSDRVDVVTLKDIVSATKAGETVVLDFSFMSEVEQYFCMVELINAIYGDLTSKERVLPEKVCLFMDELNKYGGKNETAHPIRDLLMEIAERGRSLGISLFSAQQVSSHVHPRILGNNATRVCGRTAPEEIGKEVYKYLGSQREWLLRLPKGELMVYHAPFGKTVKVKFPQPPFMLGSLA